VCARIWASSQVIDFQRIYILAQKQGIHDLSTAGSSEQILWIRLCARVMDYFQPDDFKRKQGSARFAGIRCSPVMRRPENSTAEPGIQLLHIFCGQHCAQRDIDLDNCLKAKEILHMLKLLAALVCPQSLRRLHCRGLCLWKFCTSSVDNIVRKAQASSASH
jgi:hypothetical protein